MRPLKRSTVPLVRGVLGWVRRCSIPSAWHVWSNACWPLGSRSRLANNWSVNSVPLSVSILLAAGGDLGADGRGGAGVFVQADVHGDGSNHGCNCSTKTRNTLRPVNSRWRLLSAQSSGMRNLSPLQIYPIKDTMSKKITIQLCIFN
jgi:hypothetical protein